MATNFPLSRYVLIYAENGRGKTTLSAILRSLKSGDQVHILERRRLASQNPPYVVIGCSGGPPPAIFQGGAWNRTLPSIEIFDDDFIDENVYSGLAVGTQHRQNLHQLVLGSQGVGLNQRLQDAVGQIELDNAEIRSCEAAIPQGEMAGMAVEDFCALPMLLTIDAEIAIAKQALAAAQEEGPVRDTPVFDRIEVAGFDVGALREVLQRDLPVLDALAAARVQAHVAHLGRNGESWVAEGLRMVVDRADNPVGCPFCAQDLSGSPVIAHYRAYFSQEYAALKEAVAASIASVERLHGGQAAAPFERAIRVAAERQRFWVRFTTVPEIAIDTANIVRDWEAAHDAVIATLAAKRAAPLEKLDLPQTALEAISRFDVWRQSIMELSASLLEANGSILSVKRQVAVADPRALQENIVRLKRIKARHSPGTDALCRNYQAARNAKAATEAVRDQAKLDLETYRMTAFPGYEAEINKYLVRFNAGFQIARVSAADTRGGPTCNYDIVINNVPVPVAGGMSRPGEPSFRNTLSAGDRNTLALAFFFASLDQAPELGQKIIVIDDPISSLDGHRMLTTVQELRRLGQRVSQLIVLSHEKSFLCRINEGLVPAMRTPLKIDRDATGSTLLHWDVSQDSITEHDRRHELLTEFHTRGAADDTRNVARSIRPHLEAFLRVACPGSFPPGTLLGPFRAICEQRYGNVGQILDAHHIEELRDLVEYSNRYHHDTNPAWETEAINDGELRGYVARALTFARR
jgi:wobble nucleotide-excising tRNase